MTLAVTRAPLFTPRLALRRPRRQDAAAVWAALRDPAIYAFIERAPPASAAEMEARFARVSVETAPDRAEQWLNWTVWLRESGAAIGMLDATVDADARVAIGYLFDPQTWRRGYGREAVGAMLDLLAQAGARRFEASIDVRNAASQALAARLGFARAERRGDDELWIRPAQSG